MDLREGQADTGQGEFGQICLTAKTEVGPRWIVQAPIPILGDFCLPRYQRRAEVSN
jgi:hypothetical protein